MTLTGCILFWSYINAIDPAITKAVISVESNGNPYAIGAIGDSGLMQIRPKYVPESKLQLLVPCTNVMRGTYLLAQAKNTCKNCVDLTWVNCYNLGRTGCRKLKHPTKWRYYQKIVGVMK